MEAKDTTTEKPTAADFASTQKWHVCLISPYRQGLSTKNIVVKGALTCTAKAFPLKKAYPAMHLLQKRFPSGSSQSWGLTKQTDWLARKALSAMDGRVYEDDEETEKFIEATPDATAAEAEVAKP